MDITHPKIIALRESVSAAQQEFDMAVMFHETWKPTAYDDDLHRRMGSSYATHTFNVVRVALRVRLTTSVHNSSDHETAHCSVDHGFGDVDARFIVAYEASISCEPAE